MTEIKEIRSGLVVVGWGLFFILIVEGVLLVRGAMAAWHFMWLIAIALYAACKFVTLFEAGGFKAGRAAGYLLLWPGMDVRDFLGNGSVTRPAVRWWLMAGGRILIGVGLFVMSAPVFSAGHELTAGWMGMAGLVLILHFGVFDLLALTWRTAGVRATPLMRNPAAATSVAEFWGERWNTAFHTLIHRYSFRPLVRRLGAKGALLAGFLVSGLVHELVISVPARGGYGLPTAYFMIQGFGVLVERSDAGRRMRLKGGWRGWLFTLACTISPAGLLFHEPFIRTVILPMLHAFGAF